MDAIEDGMYQPAMKTGMEELDHQKAEIEARLAEAPADLPDVHPNIAEHYRAKVIRPAEMLAEPESNANPGITPATSGPNGNARGHLKPKSQTFQDYVVRSLRSGRTVAGTPTNNSITYGIHAPGAQRNDGFSELNGFRIAWIRPRGNAEVVTFVSLGCATVMPSQPAASQ